jgi:hypothetical protein
MTRALKSFDGLSLKVVAVDPGANRDVSLQFPALSPRARFPAATTSLEPLMERHRDSLAETNEWHVEG